MSNNFNIHKDLTSFVDRIYKTWSDLIVKILRYLFLLSIINISFVQAARAADVMDTIIDILSGLTCETKGVGDLLRSEFSHTCIPAPFFTLMVANLVSPGIYANTLLRLKINDKEIFPDACLRKNRIDANTPTELHNEKLTFAMCSNIKLALVRAKAVVMSAVYIAQAMFDHKDPWENIKNAWIGEKKEYHEIFEDKEEGWQTTWFDLGIIPIFPLKVIKDKDKLCVATIAFTGWIPVGCKYIKEPFPKSKYSSYMDLSDAPNSKLSNENVALQRCGSGGGCYIRAYNNSRTGIVITAPLIECIREMTARLMVSRDSCDFSDINLVMNSASRDTSALFTFQKNMHRTVSALLTIYVILFGFKVVLTRDAPPKAEWVNFVLKFIFVVYFSVGININAFNGSDYNRLDGMIQWAFPFLLGGISAMANWVMAASPSELCKFAASEYPDMLGHLSLWDSLDCRVSHYLGLDMIKTMMVENQARSHDFKNFDFFNFAIPPYYYLLIPAAISGNMTLVSLALMYPLLVISVAAYLVNATVICMIGIVILGVLAPLFVPMFLFEYTKGYFESWAKLMLSFMLQPMVVVVFMVTMFSVYDFGFYGKCQYTSSEIMSGDRKTKIFYLDNDWEGSYAGDKEKIESCQKSLGYMLNNPVQALYNYSKKSVSEMGGSDDDSAENYLKRFAFMAAIVYAPVMFFVSPKTAFDMIKDIILALVTACFTLYLLYHFSAQLSEFAADMTEGVSLSSVTIKPQAIFKAGMAALSAAGGAMKGAQAAKGAGGAADKISGDRGGASDKMSTGSGEASDKMSTGGGTSSDNRMVVSDKSSTQSQSPSDTKPPSSSSTTRTKETGPMEKLDSDEVSARLTDFLGKKNVDANWTSGFMPEFSRYVALSSDPKKADKVAPVYDAMLRQKLENPAMKGHEAEFINKIEGMYSGDQKEKIVAMNDKILKDLNIERVAPSESDKFTSRATLEKQQLTKGGEGTKVPLKQEEGKKLPQTEQQPGQDKVEKSTVERRDSIAEPLALMPPEPKTEPDKTSKEQQSDQTLTRKQVGLPKNMTEGQKEMMREKMREERANKGQEKGSDSGGKEQQPSGSKKGSIDDVD